jgi:hypothetical protein
MTRAKAVATVRRILTDNAYANARFGTDLSLVTIDTATAEALVRPMGVLEANERRAERAGGNGVAASSTPEGGDRAAIAAPAVPAFQHCNLRLDADLCVLPLGHAGDHMTCDGQFFDEIAF